jgi:apolipoprotein N-acyltransferase
VINIFTSKKISLYLLPFIGGLLYATGFPNSGEYYFFPGPIIGIALWLNSVSLNYPNDRKVSRLGKELLSLFCFSLGYCLLGYYWIPYTLNEFGSIPFPLDQLLGILFSLIIVPQYILFLIIHTLVKKLRFKTSYFVSSATHRNIVIAFLLTLLEYYTPQQFPAHMGHPWLFFAPYLGLAPIFGAPLFSFTGFWLSLSLVSFLRTKTLDFLALAFTATVVIANFAIPLTLWTSPDQIETNYIRLVQPNIGNFLKISSEDGDYKSLDKVLKLYTDLSTAPSEKPLDLIFWPETAYPRLLNSRIIKKNKNMIPALMRDTVYQTQAELLTGGYDRASSFNSLSFETEYNTAFFISADLGLTQTYHKMKLIPFGESLPFGPFNAYLSQFIQNISYFASGKEYSLFKTRKGTLFSAAICYEILFSRFIADYLNGVKDQPDFLVNLTNDSWYGDTAEPFQHQFLAKWRAVEFQIPIVRTTNTGVSSILLANGGESKRLAPFVEGKLDLELISPERKGTPFQRLGILNLFIIFLILFGGLRLFRKKKIRTI